jgi:hypothetical protein
MALEFSHVITSEEQLREVIGHPSHRVTKKILSALDKHCRAFIAKSPFLLVRTALYLRVSTIHQKPDLQADGLRLRRGYCRLRQPQGRS